MVPTKSLGNWTRFKAAIADPRAAHFEHFFGRIVFRQRRAGRDGVDVDVIVADFARERAREADDAGFRSDVVNSSGAAVERGAGRDVDDLAGLLLAHGRQHGAAAEKQAFQIDRHHAVPFRRIDGVDAAAVHRNGREDRRVVDQDVDAAEFIEREFGHVLGRCFVGNIDFGRQCFAVELLDDFAGDFFRGGRVDVSDDDFRARFGESRGSRPGRCRGRRR